MPPGSGVGPWEGVIPYHLREQLTSASGAHRFAFIAPFAADRANSTNSAGERHAPNAERAALAMDCTRHTGLSPRHWLQQRWAARTLAGSMALPPFEMGVISSSSSAYGWRAG